MARLRFVPAPRTSATPPPGSPSHPPPSSFSSLSTIAGRPPPPLSTSFSSSWSGLPFTSSPFACFNFSPDRASKMLVNSVQASLGIEKMHKKKLVGASGHEAQSGLPCDSERGGRGGRDGHRGRCRFQWMQKPIPASDIYNGNCGHLWLHTSMPTHIFVSSPTRDAPRWILGKSVAGCELARIANSLAQLPCLPVGWWLQQVTFADIAVIMAL